MCELSDYKLSNSPKSKINFFSDNSEKSIVNLKWNWSSKSNKYISDKICISKKDFCNICTNIVILRKTAIFKFIIKVKVQS